MTTQQAIETLEKRLEELNRMIVCIESGNAIGSIPRWGIELLDKTNLLIALRALEKAKEQCNDHFNPYTWVCECRNDLNESIQEISANLESK